MLSNYPYTPLCVCVVKILTSSVLKQIQFGCKELLSLLHRVCCYSNMPCTHCEIQYLHCRCNEQIQATLTFRQHHFYNGCNNEFCPIIIIAVGITVDDCNDGKCDLHAFCYQQDCHVTIMSPLLLSARRITAEWLLPCLFCRVAGARSAVHRLCEFVVIKAG